MTANWRTHTHEPNDPWAYQHGPNLYTHDASGKVDMVMGQRMSGEEAAVARTLFSVCCGAPPHPSTPDVSKSNTAGNCGACCEHTMFEPAPDICYNCGEERDDQIDSEYCDECREQGR